MSSSHIPLADVKRLDCLGLLRDAMKSKHVGPATQTLAALRRLASKNGETFASVGVIAEVACLKEWTVKRHLKLMIRHGWLTKVGRRGRRTPTYKVPLDLLNRSSARKFALLPRWAAKMLPTWGERAVLALIVSRDSLCGFINGDDLDAEDDTHAALERRTYSVTTLATDSGLSRQAITDAKRKLAKRKIITIDPSCYWRDFDGTIRTMADGLLLNPHFKVPAGLIERRKPQPARKRNAETVTPHRSLEMLHDPVQKCSRPQSKNAPDPVQKCSLQLSELLNQPLKRTSKSTSATPTAADEVVAAEVCGRKKTKAPKRKPKPAEPERGPDIRTIDFEDRRRILADKLRAEMAVNTA